MHPSVALIHTSAVCAVEFLAKLEKAFIGFAICTAVWKQAVHKVHYTTHHQTMHADVLYLAIAVADISEHQLKEAHAAFKEEEDA